MRKESGGETLSFRLGILEAETEGKLTSAFGVSDFLPCFLSVLLGFHSSMEFPHKARGSRSLPLGLGSLMELRRFLAAQLVILSHTVLKLMISLGW